MTAFAGFLTARDAAKAMVPRSTGTMRALAQSMARELGPQNIHVAHAIVDGAIDTE